MILGIGNDFCDIRRIENTLEKFGDRFIARVFTDGERRKADGVPASLAKRFAAKEACAKALGTGIQDGIFLRDIEVVNLQNGAPTLMLHGGAAARLATLTPAELQSRLWLSLSDDYPYAQAFVVIEAA